MPEVGVGRSSSDNQAVILDLAILQNYTPVSGIEIQGLAQQYSRIFLAA